MNFNQNSSTPPSSHVNPFSSMSLPEIYKLLLAGDPDKCTPRWPDEKLQKGYTGTCGVDLLRRAFNFTDMLAKDGAFIPGWRGLDYGCGWGRFGSVMLSRGAPSQFDLADAWPKTLNVLAELGYSNKVLAVSELLKPGEIPEGEYDFVMSFSVFTHLSPTAFETNIPLLLAALQPGGRFYLTVRHDEFIDHKYADKASMCRDILARDGVLFLDSGGNLGAEKIFGDTVITPGYLSSFARQPNTIRYLGQPHSLQHVYVIEKH